MTQPVSGGANLQYMINGSKAVLSTPAVATFEEYERNDLNWATIYVLIGAAITAVLQAIGAALGLSPTGDTTAQPSVAGALLAGVTGALIGYFIWLSLVYFIGRLFGGTGQFGELAFDVSLYWAPLSVVTALAALVPIVGGLVGLAAFIYNVYLTYLSIQSGMNLPKDKALYVMLIIVGIFTLLICGLVALIALVFGAAGAFSQPQ